MMNFFRAFFGKKKKILSPFPHIGVSLAWLSLHRVSYGRSQQGRSLLESQRYDQAHRPNPSESASLFSLQRETILVPVRSVRVFPGWDSSGLQPTGTPTPACQWPTCHPTLPWLGKHLPCGLSQGCTPSSRPLEIRGGGCVCGYNESGKAMGMNNHRDQDSPTLGRITP